MTAIRQEVRARQPVGHPYIPNSDPEIEPGDARRRRRASVEEFYADVPADLRLRRALDLPEPLSPSRTWCVTSAVCCAATARSSPAGSSSAPAPTSTRARGGRRGHQPQRVPHRVRRRAVRGPRPVPGAVPVPVADGRTARTRTSSTSRPTTATRPPATVAGDGRPHHRPPHGAAGRQRRAPRQAVQGARLRRADHRPRARADASTASPTSPRRPGCSTTTVAADLGRDPQLHRRARDRARRARRRGPRGRRAS